MARYALLLEYDGSEYYGWQIQKDTPTIQEKLERALSKFANQTITTITAGRTDTGVHAMHQVVHFDSDVTRTLHGWINGVNTHLPPSIRVKHVTNVDISFNARFSALSRTYHYYLLLQPQTSAHLNSFVGWYYKDLDVASMQVAANLLVGKHDFSSFRASGCQANTPIREMHEIKLERQGNILRFSLCANAFLHHMVRNIVGALVYVGNGRLTVEQFATIFRAAERKLAPPTFMPNGLYLVDVEYPQEIFVNPDMTIWRYNG
jgi:tRNA pseudouridine38-40 synthase